MQVVELNADALRKIFPRAPQKYIDGLMAQKSALDRAGITTTRTRLAYCLANVEHECGGFTIPNLTENINYTAERMAQVWPNRFGSAADVRAKFGTAPGWQKGAFDVIYGNRMGNRPGTNDGSKYIGRGAPQITGRDGYREVGRRSGIPLEERPELASAPGNQSPIIAAFWSWKGLNPLADAGQWTAVVRRWNGGTNGLADREAKMRGNDPVISKLAFVEAAIPILTELPGGPAPHNPPKDVIDKATKNERSVRNVGAGGAATGAGAEGVKTAIEQPTLISHVLTYTLIGVGLVAFVVAAVLIARKVQRIKENWI